MSYCRALAQWLLVFDTLPAAWIGREQVVSTYAALASDPEGNIVPLLLDPSRPHGYITLTGTPVEAQ